MGDSGSRPIGLLLGVLVLLRQSVFDSVVAFVVLVNGATGLIKVALLRFFKSAYSIRSDILYMTTWPNMGWSNTQVLVRFMLLQAVGTPILLVLLLKIR